MSVKPKTSDYDKEIHAIFSNNMLLMCYTEYYTYGNVIYNFCIYFDCKVKIDLTSTGCGRRNRN